VGDDLLAAGPVFSVLRNIQEKEQLMMGASPQTHQEGGLSILVQENLAALSKPEGLERETNRGTVCRRGTFHAKGEKYKNTPGFGSRSAKYQIPQHRGGRGGGLGEVGCKTAENWKGLGSLKRG